MSMLHPEFETLSPSEIRRTQDALWRRQWDYVKTHSAFYRRKFGKAIESEIFLDTLEKLPFTDKDELRLSQEGTYPFGDYIACAPESVSRLQVTSGTTGRALILANSHNDLAWITRIGGRAFHAAGLRSSDRVVHCLNYCMWTGGLTDHMNLEAAGACVIPFGVGNVDKLLDTIQDLKVTAISCTPSYPALLEKRLQERGQHPRDLGLRLGLFGGEAGLDNLDFRRHLEATWGFEVRNANYGMSEVMSIFASQSELSHDLHFHAADAVFIELIDKTGASIPIMEGNSGELVCTHLRKECQPLIRYRTRDLVTITGTDVAACGRTSWRFRVIGRSDDMFNVRGINIFPGAVQEAILSRPDLTTGQFRIRLQGEGPWDRIELSVEAVPGITELQQAAVTQELEAAIKSQTGASARITLLASGTLPRTDGKTNLIERV